MLLLMLLELVLITTIFTQAYYHKTKKEIVFQRWMEPYMPQLMKQESINDLVSMAII